MDVVFMSALATAFGAGLLATLSPCVYPLIPVTLGYFGTQMETGRRTRVLSFSFGQWLALSLLGVAAVFLGEALGFTSEVWWVKVSFGVLLILFGIVSWFNKLPAVFSRFGGFSGEGGFARRFPLLGAAVVGFGTALVMSPCTTPLLAAVLTSAATQPSPLRGTVLMSAYAFGFSSVIMIVGLGLLSLRNLPRSGRWLGKIHVIASLAILAFGLWQFGSGLYDFLVV